MIRAERHGDVSLITLERPERRNALDEEACRSLAAAVNDASGAGSRAVVLAGAGPHFCAGADLTGLHDQSFADDLRSALVALSEAPLVTIAAVHGAALGAGTQLALACDLRVAEAEARFGIPAARLGLMVDHWTVQRLALVAGFGPARALLLAADELDGRTAHSLGMVQRLAPPGAAQQVALEWAAEIAALAPLTLAGHKVALNALEQRVGADPDVAAAFRRAWTSEDLAEGMAARADRRPPRFKGR